MKLPCILAVAIALTTPIGTGANARGIDAAAEGNTRTLYLSLIRQARADGKARAAIAYLDDFDRQHPADHEAQILRVNCLLDLGQVASAQIAAERLSPSDRSGEAMAVRGHVLAALGRWPEAVTAYVAAQMASPADPFIGNALGYAQVRTGQFADGIETLKRALDLAPDVPHGSAVVRNNLALALTAAGRIDEATSLVASIRDGDERAKLRVQLAAEATRLSVSDRIDPPVAQ